MSSNKNFVFFDGPFMDKSSQNYWTVFIGSDKCAPLDNLFCIKDYRTARFLAEDLADDRGLELYVSASKS